MSRFWRMRLIELALLAVLAVLFTAAGAVVQLIVYGHVRW
jgi:hypothetical protein